MLFRSATTGNQWYLNGTSLSGATLHTYNATQTGTYTVKLTGAHGCSSTSLPYQLMTTGIQENSIVSNFVIIPNPNNGVFRLETMNQQSQTIQIFNSIGELVFQSRGENSNTMIDVSDQPNGIYLIHINGENRSCIKQLIINK